MTEKSDVLNNQAILLASDGFFDDAIACFKRAITIDKNNYLLWYNMGITFRDEGKLLEAQKALATASALAPDNMDVAETYATITLMLKDYKMVQIICEDALDFNPLSPHLWNLMGVSEFNRENYELAAEYFEQAVSINPYYEDALYNLKDTYSQLENKHGEVECMARIKDL